MKSFFCKSIRHSGVSVTLVCVIRTPCALGELGDDKAKTLRCKILKSILINLLRCACPSGSRSVASTSWFRPQGATTYCSWPSSRPCRWRRCSPHATHLRCMRRGVSFTLRPTASCRPTACGPPGGHTLRPAVHRTCAPYGSPDVRTLRFTGRAGGFDVDCPRWWI